MNLNNENMKELQEKATKILNESENKGEAISQVIDMFINAKNEDLINEITAQATKASSDSEYASKLGLRPLSKEEEKYYQSILSAKQEVKGEQEDLIPTSIIDLTMEEVKTSEPVLNIINFAPANVKKWLVAEKSGVYSWDGLTDKLKGEIKAGFSSLQTDLNKLDAYLIIPKSISKLSLPFVDKYFRAILLQVLREGLAHGYLNGTGVNEPIGIYKQIEKVNENQTHKDKEVSTDLTRFSPKALAPAKVYLSNGGKRVIDKLYLICNPEDRANYVDPCIYDKQGNLVSSHKNLTVIECTENPKGKAALTLDKKYVMGVDAIETKSYDQTLALEDADVLIGKVHANGRAIADNVAYVFDVTKLEEYVPEVKVVNMKSNENSEENSENKEA